MILYKNVDIKDLESILSKGILSLNKSGNNNWDDNKRASNSCDVVYLFNPLTEQNSFCNYGAVLLQIDIPDNEVKENQIGSGIQRSNQRSKYHIKDLTCLNPGCNGDITKNIEVRYCDSFDEMMDKAKELHREYY